MLGFFKLKNGEAIVGMLKTTRKEDKGYVIENALNCIQDIDEEEGIFLHIFTPLYPMYIGGTIYIRKEDVLFTKTMPKEMEAIYGKQFESIVTHNLSFRDHVRKSIEEEKKVLH